MSWDYKNIQDALESAWILIANAYNGDWSQAPEPWRAAAENWRDGVLPEDHWARIIGDVGGR